MNGREDAIEQQEIPEFEQRLRARWRELRDEIQDVLRRIDNERFQEVAGRVHDVEDASFAALVVDINNAEIQRDVQEMRDIDAALQRISEGTYGICARCRQPIARARLEANPTARFCIRCQDLIEKTHQSVPTPRL